MTRTIRTLALALPLAAAAAPAASPLPAASAAPVAPVAPQQGSASVQGTMTIAGRSGEAIDPAGAVVWLEGDAGGPSTPAGGAPAPAGAVPERATPAPERAVIDMRSKSFQPAVVAVPVGSSVSFQNDDPILHNVFSVSSGNQFDLGLYGRGDGRAVVFKEPGVVRIFCNVHPQMEAFVVVTPGPWRAAVGADGHFAIDGVPAGRYQMQAWDARGGAASYPVEVTAGGTARVDVRLDASEYRKRPHLDKNGRPYTDRDRY
jgi:plastocyanin